MAFTYKNTFRILQDLSRFIETRLVTIGITKNSNLVLENTNERGEFVETSEFTVRKMQRTAAMES